MQGQGRWIIVNFGFLSYASFSSLFSKIVRPYQGHWEFPIKTYQEFPGIYGTWIPRSSSQEFQGFPDFIVSLAKFPVSDVEVFHEARVIQRWIVELSTRVAMFNF